MRDPRFARFFAAACRAGDKAPALRVSALRCGDAIAGIEISVACKGELFGHVLAPNPAFATLGVGGILAEATVVAALEQGYCGQSTCWRPPTPTSANGRRRAVDVADYEVTKTLAGALYARIWLGWGREAAKHLAERIRTSRRRAAGASRSDLKGTR